MRKIFTILYNYLQEHFNFKLYLAFFLYTAGLIITNYIFNLEDMYIHRFKFISIRMICFFILHTGAFYGMLLITTQITKKKSFWKSKNFWIISLTGFLILSFDRASQYHRLLSPLLQYDTQTFIFKVTKNLSSILSLILPIIIFYNYWHKKYLSSFYGIHLKKINFKPYLAMLFLMIAPVYLASLSSDFLSTYPRYQYSFAESFIKHYKISKLSAISIFETAYLTNFIYVELFFRGFLVIGLAKILGKETILPMAVTYVVLHFGKPLGETISSAFGGYILGVLALQTGNIWGGIFIHIGIAFLMEMFAFIQGI